MSYAAALASGALTSLRALELSVQELILDEIDRLADAAEFRTSRPLPTTVSHEIRRQTAAHVQDIFLKVFYDSPQRRLTIVRIGYVARPK